MFNSNIQTAFHWSTLHRLTCCVQVVLDSFPAAVSGCWRWVKNPGQVTSSQQWNTERQTSAHTCRQSGVASQTNAHVFGLREDRVENTVRTHTLFINLDIYNWAYCSEFQEDQWSSSIVYVEPVSLPKSIVVMSRLASTTAPENTRSRMDSSDWLTSKFLPTGKFGSDCAEERCDRDTTEEICARFLLLVCEVLIPAQFCGISATRPEFWLLLNTDFGGRTRRLTLDF